jgi:hypothetical protein
VALLATVSTSTILKKELSLSLKDNTEDVKNLTRSLAPPEPLSALVRDGAARVRPHAALE